MASAIQNNFRVRKSFAAVEGTPESALTEVIELLKCGTNCGSCLPELKRLAAESRVANEVCQ